MKEGVTETSTCTSYTFLQKSVILKFDRKGEKITYENKI